MIPFEFIKKHENDESKLSGQVNFAEIDFDNEKMRLEKRLFNIRTYDGLRKTGWKSIEPANRFIRENFDLDEYEYLVRLFVRAKRELSNSFTGNDVVNAVTTIDGYVYKLFKKLNLSKRIHDFVVNDKNISLPDFSNIEVRPQDTAQKTFYEDEYHLINTITIISKILAPIFGEVIYKIKFINDAYKGMKEIVAFGIINTLLREDFPGIIDKLENYICKMIERFVIDDPMITFNGITATSLTNFQLAKIVVKNFANIDLYEKNGNVIRSVYVTLKRSIENETRGSSKQLTYKERLMLENGDDDQNTSLLENSINTVSEPVETPIIVKFGINRFINDYIQDNNINTNLFDEIVKYYKITLLQPSPINELIVALFVSDPIGSAYCVKYMDMEMMIKVIAIIQLYAMNMGFKTIVPLLSMNPTNMVKVETNEVDNRIIISNGRGSNKNSINYFISLSEAVAHIRDWNGFNFSDYMRSVMMFLVENIFTYNVAPGILSIGNTGTSIKDDQGFLRYDDNIIAELHRFMYHLLKMADIGRKIN